MHEAIIGIGLAPEVGELLERAGYKIRMATAHDALLEVRRTKDPVIVADFRHHPESGELMSLPAGIAAIVADDQAGMQALRLGCSDYLVPPLDESSLTRAVERARQQGGQEARFKEELEVTFRTQLEDNVDQMRKAMQRLLRRRQEDARTAIAGAVDELRPVVPDHPALDRIMTELNGLMNVDLAPDMYRGSATGFNAGSVVEHLIAEMRAMAEARGVVVNLSAMPVVVHLDRVRFVEAMETFLAMAIQSDGTTKLDVRMEAQADVLTISLDHNGLLQTANDLRKVLEPSQDNLEVFSARKAIELMGGSVEVRRHETSGAGLDIKLPRVADEGRVVRALYIEDDEHDCILLQAIVRRLELPMLVETAPNMHLARERLAKGGIDLIFLDLHLPDASDDDIVVIVNKWARVIPIVVVSGDAEGTLAARVVEAGTRDFIPKNRLNDRAVMSSLLRSALMNRAIMRAVNPR